jgi:hypothetical protein
MHATASGILAIPGVVYLVETPGRFEYEAGVAWWADIERVRRGVDGARSVFAVIHLRRIWKW